MDKLKATLFTALVIAILFTPTASAQPTAAKIEVVSGNGQLICPTCQGARNTFFFPMVVKVTDASGNPIGGKTVNWLLVGATNGVQPVFNSSTLTDSHGLSANTLGQGFQFASTFILFLQSLIGASVDGVSVSFTETEALTSAFNNQLVFAVINTPNGTVLSGPAGSTGATAILIHIDAEGTPLPNVSVRLLNSEITTASGLVVLDPAQPSASCATGPGADPGSVLTDAFGNASCFPVFGPVPGSGPVTVLVGGLDPAEFDQTSSPQPLSGPVSFHEFANWVQIVVAQVNPGLVSIVSGNNQSVDPGKSSAPLIVKVTDATGLVPIGNTSVAWTVTPAGAATVIPVTSITNAQGQTQATVAFSPLAAGQVTVRAALTGSNSGISTTFTLSTTVLIASLAKVSGDLQTTQSGQIFIAPLIVQVNGTNGQPLSNQPVSFVLNGTATLSAASVLTDATGRAQITVTAGATPGTLTVTAFIGSISQTFTLTIIPPGPALNSSSFFNAGGATRLGAISPCSLVTVFTSGLAPSVQGLVFNTNVFGPWATTLASDTVTVAGIAAPIYSVGNVSGAEQLTFQVPCEVAPANGVPITINVGGGVGTVTFPVQAASPGIFETVMSDGARRAVVVRPDGTFVSLQNPARRGEIVRVFVTGLGATTPPVSTGALPVPGSDSLVLGQVIVGVNNGGTRVVTVRLSPNLIGVFEVAFQVASDAATGNDVVLSVAVNAPGESVTRFSNGSKLPIQ